jgi:hypothetical protein
MNRDRGAVSEGWWLPRRSRRFSGAAVDLVGRSVLPERREAELANLIAVADEIVGGIRDRPVGE